MMMAAAFRQTTSQNEFYKQKKRLSQSAHDRGKPWDQAVFASLPTGIMARIVYLHCIKDGTNIDPCCGSGAFLVRAMTEAMEGCDTEEEREHVRKKQIFGIEYEETAFGLSTTNMLIHGDGNSNIVQGSCFKVDNYVDSGVNVVLMNPPYNAQRKHCNPEYVKTWKAKAKEDPSKGFHYVYEMAERVKTGRLAVLLPTQCAIGYDAEIKSFKKKMLEKHTLDAVLSFPPDMLHPAANVNAR